MAFKKNEGKKIGEWYFTNRKIESISGYFEKGTKVKIIGEGVRGYDLQDEKGNTIVECGYSCIE